MKIQCPNNIKIGKKKENKFFIHVDMDGVMSFWLKEACKVCDIDMKDEKIYQELKKGVYLEDIDGLITSEDMWDKVEKEGTDFWANLELFPWAKKLIAEMEKLGQVYILTSPGTCVPAPTGKMIWIKKYFPQLLKKLIICKDKERLATPNSILIDDTEGKIEAFRKEGGHAFLWPNFLKLLDGDIDADETIDKLVSEIKGYANG